MCITLYPLYYNWKLLHYLKTPEGFSLSVIELTVFLWAWTLSIIFLEFRRQRNALIHVGFGKPIELKSSLEFTENTRHCSDKHTFCEWNEDKGLEYPFSPFCVPHLHLWRLPSTDLRFILIWNNFHQDAFVHIYLATKSVSSRRSGLSKPKTCLSVPQCGLSGSISLS